MDMKLEVVVLPVSDVDRAKDFYLGLGWRLDADFTGGADFRVIQLTPPGSPCSIIFGTGVSAAPPGSIEVFHDADGVFHRAGIAGRVPGPDPKRGSYNSFLSFSDPDGNGWTVQEIVTRLPGR